MFLVLIFLVIQSFAEILSPPPFETFYFNQHLDSFNFVDSKSFSQRYLVCSSFINKTKNTPLFVYTGNEGDIVAFYNNTGYYGKSIVKDDYRYLSADLAISDYVTLLNFIIKKYEIKGPVILFGGSYGGMISSWMRIKFPHLVSGTLASSAPNLAFSGTCDPYLFGKIITNSFSRYQNCGENIRNGFVKMKQFIDTKKYRNLSTIFHTCEEITSESDAWKLVNLLEGVVELLACIDYPTKSEFLSPLPAYPVQYCCKKISEKPEILSGMYELFNTYYNFTGQCKCIDFNWHKPILSSKLWRYERCTDIVLPIGYNSVTDFFLPKKWNLTLFIEDCKKEFPNINPKPYWIETDFHGNSLRYPEIDPWSACGVYTENIKNQNVYSIVIENAAHHLDLRFPSKNDPSSVIQAREEEKKIIEKWINEFYQK